MKVLQVNCVYANGSTGKITQDLHHELSARGIDSVVCYGRGESVNEQGVYKVCSEAQSHFYQIITMLNGLMYSSCASSTGKLISIIKKENPDIVHLQCINGYFVNIYKLIEWLKQNKIKTLLTLHAEFMYTAGCGIAQDCEKWKTGCGSCPRLKAETKSLLFDGTAKSFRKMKKAFEGFETLEVSEVSPWLKSRAEVSPILKDFPHSVVLNGLETDTFTYKGKTNSNKKKIFFATPYFSADKDNFKGGYFVLELAKRLPDAQFTVAGRCEDKNITVPENVKLLGQVNSAEEMASLYSEADLCLITSKRETFSMVTAESLCCGTPVAGFMAGAPEMIALEEYSTFVPYGDLDALETAVKQWLETDVNKEKISQKAREKYSKQAMAQGYINLYKKLMEKTNV